MCFITLVKKNRLLEKSYPGEIVFRRNCTQKIGFNFSWRNRTQVRLLLEKSNSGTTSPGEIVLNSSISGEVVPTKFWVWLLLVKNFVNFSQKVLGTTSSLKGKTLSFIIKKCWVQFLLREKIISFSIIKLWLRFLLREKKNCHF